jgi:hypothetical protein
VFTIITGFVINCVITAVLPLKLPTHAIFHINMVERFLITHGYRVQKVGIEPISKEQGLMKSYDTPVSLFA